MNVLEEVRQADCRRLVNTSMSEVYGTPESVPIREQHPPQGHSPYSASKIAAACRVLGVTATVVQDEAHLRPNASEVMVLLSDPSKAKRLLGWEAVVPLDKGLAQTAAWLGLRLGSYDPERYHV